MPTLRSTLCVVPEYQCQGIGSYVTQTLVNAACARGRGVVLLVLKANERARRLYERLGFEVVSESTHHYQMRFNTLHPGIGAGDRMGG